MATNETPSPRSVIRLRNFRNLHRKISIALFVFFFIVAGTGLLLAWKKNSGGMILPPTSKGVSDDLKTWLPFDSLQTLAIKALHDSVSPSLRTDIERIDARPGKGSVKFVFDDDYWEVQLDGTTGEVLLIATRRSDIIEHIHDGTILDVLFGTEGNQFKLTYSTIMGTSLLMLIITGFWLWYGPKKYRKEKQETHE